MRSREKVNGREWALLGALLLSFYFLLHYVAKKVIINMDKCIYK